MNRLKPHHAHRRRAFGSRQHEQDKARRGNAGICGRCGGVGTIWTGEKRITCPKCAGTGLRPKE